MGNLFDFFYNPYVLLHIIIGNLFLLMGVFVYVQNKKSLSNISYLFVCITISLWLLFDAATMSSKNQEPAFFWARMVYVGVSLIPPSMYFFTVAWLGLMETQKRWVNLFYAIGFVFIGFFLFTDILIIGTNHYYFGYYSHLGPYSAIFLLFFTGLSCALLWHLYQGYKRETVPVKKTHIRNVLIAFFFGLNIGMTEYLPTYGIEFYPIGFIAIFILGTVIAYTIARYRLMDIETVLHKTALWILSFAIIFIPILLFYNYMFPHMLHSRVLQIAFGAGSFIVFAIYLRQIQPKIDHFFQRRKANLEEISSRFAEDLVQLKGINNLVKRIEETISDTLYPQKVGIYIYNEKKKKLELANQTNEKGDKLTFERDQIFLEWLRANNRIAHRDYVQIDPQFTPVKEQAEEYFDQAEATVAVPLVLNDALLGVINLSKKANLERYKALDFQFLATLKNQSAIAISNSLIYQNIEEQVKLRTEELVETQKQLIQAEKLATVGTLSGGVAHEINNPLTAILTNVQMLLADQGETVDADRDTLELVEEATQRCRTIVQKLMVYAKKPVETSDLSEVNLLDVVNKAVSFLNYQLQQDGITIEIDAKEENYPVMGNHNELEQVVTNIVLNARDAIAAIKKSGCIKISLLKEKNEIKMNIQDDGKGIAEDVLPRIFDPFFTTKDVGEGLGLGLSISHTIMDKYKGQISVESSVKKGSKFIIKLPISLSG